jgi:hypothetical protein
MAEHERYTLLCPQCGAKGEAEWWENDGWAYLRDPTTLVGVSDGFELGEKVPSGPESFFGRRLSRDEARRALLRHRHRHHSNLG